jgi:hypothetical protein
MRLLRRTTRVLTFALLVFTTTTDSLTQYVQQGNKLVGTNSIGGSIQGCAVALSSDGNTALVGGMWDNNYVGATWAYARMNGVWSQQGNKIVGTIPSGNQNVHQGYSVSLSADGNTAMIGGPYDGNYRGAVWVFTRFGGTWSQQGDRLIGTGGIGGSYQGCSVSLSADGNTALIGAPFDNNSVGAAWIFTRAGNVWTQQGGKLVGTGAVGSSMQGICVSLSADGNTALVGGMGDNYETGAVWIYVRSGEMWSQQGAKLVGTGSIGTSRQGWSLCLSSDGNTAAVGGYTDNNTAGATWVFTRSGNTWSQQGNKLIATDAVSNAHQGYAVALSASGDIAMIGGAFDNNSVGATWVFTRNGGVWSQQGNKMVGTGATGTAYQGCAAALSADGRTGIIGGHKDNNLVGAAWVFVSATGPPTILSVADVPGDQGGKVEVRWEKSPGDDTLSTLQRVQYYSIWRAVPSGYLQHHPPSQPRLHDAGGKTPGKLSDGLAYDWVWIADQPARNTGTYTCIVPTMYDSMAATNGMHYFLVSAHTSNAGIYWDSEPDSGYSVDNLRPSSPTRPTIHQLTNGNTDLRWNRVTIDPDISHYVVYRSTTNGFPVSGSAFLCSTTDTSVTDSTAQSGVRYYYRITSLDIHGNESDPTIQLRAALCSVSLFDDWNLISNPITAPNDTVRMLYPTSIFEHVYQFSGLYVKAGTMENGVGYWGKFSGVGTQALTGAARERDSIHVLAGWNMIGTISDPVQTDSIQEIPPTIIASLFCDYNGGYTPVTELTPGKSYWVYVSGQGSLVLSSDSGATMARKSTPRLLAEYPELTIAGRGSRGQTLYFALESSLTRSPDYFRLPPPPPEGAFDARFATGRMLECARGEEARIIPIRVTSAKYPMTVTWNVKGQPVVASLVVGGREVKLEGAGTISLNDASASLSLKLGGHSSIPGVYALAQNFPNPFNPITTIKYDLPKDSRVSLTVINILGQEVVSLVNEVQKAGHQSVEWNASNLGSGVYYYRLTAGDFVSVRKMLLLK